MEVTNFVKAIYSSKDIEEMLLKDLTSRGYNVEELDGLSIDRYEIAVEFATKDKASEPPITSTAKFDEFLGSNDLL